MIDVGDVVTVSEPWPEVTDRTFGVWKVDPPLLFARELEPPNRLRAFPTILARNETGPRLGRGPVRTEKEGVLSTAEDNMRTGESA